MQLPQRTAELPRLRRRSLLVVWDELPQRHPQPVLLVRPRRQDVGRRDDQVGPLGQEDTDGHLARQPLLGVIVQERRPGHHPRHDRCGLQMHQHVAARRDPHRLVAGHAVLTGNGLRGRERPVVGRHRDATVTWIAWGSRIQAIIPRAARRSRTNWKASAWARLR